MNRRGSWGLEAAIALVALGCGNAGHQTGFDASTGPQQTPDSSTHKLPTMGGDGAIGSGGDGGNTVFTPTGPVTDFPAPVLDGTAPANAAALFGAASQGAATGGPCIAEPESNVLYPQDWLRPRFRWTAVGGQNLFELRLHVANQLKDLVVYSSNTTWTMPQAMWNSLRTDSPTEAMTLTIRGGVYNGTTLTGEALGSSYPIGVAPVQASGAIVYWTTSTGTALKGFQVGDSTVYPVLQPSQVSETSTTCIGCHTSSPDGEFVGFSLSGANGWPNAMALINADAGAVGTPPAYLGVGGKGALSQYNLGIASFSRAHWASGDHREVVAFDNQGSTTNVLEWIDLEASTAATATGVIARNGDPASAGAPAWSHDGNTIAYVSTSHFCDGRLGAGCDGVTYNAASDPGSTADLYTVPYSGGAGGAAKPVSGASDPSLQEYYPVFSPDDSLLAFCRAPNGANMYDQAEAEVFVIPSSGGTATRLAANAPPSCTGQTSPGITNSWPKWGPVSQTAGASTYYWLVFSSTRPGNPQLYITAVVLKAGRLSTYGAIYLWNQPASENNHTPAWDTFKGLPPVTGQPK